MEYIKNKRFYLIELLQSKGKRTFTVSEAQSYLQISRSNVLVLLSKLKKEKRILALTKGFYALWPPSERKWGIDPTPILDPFMRFKKSRYYVGLLSAADYHGVAHQKPQVLQVIIPKPMHLRYAIRSGIHFYIKKNFPTQGIETAPTQSGQIFYSALELTLLDILHFQKQSAGFDNVCLVIKDSVSNLRPQVLKDIATTYPYIACIQKLGYLLAYFQTDPKLIHILFQRLRKNKLTPIALSPSHPAKGKVNKTWHVIENIKISGEES